MRISTRHVCSTAVVAAALLLAAPAMAQEGSKRPIRMIVAVAPAGSTDIIARLVASRLTERLDQQVVVDNRPGAGGLIGVEIVARSQPDGHTLLLGSGSLGTINSFFPKAPFHAQKDLEPMALLPGPRAIVARARSSTRRLAPVPTADRFVADRPRPTARRARKR